MTDIDVRTTGRVGRITLTRPHALNALTYPMCRAIDECLDRWSGSTAIDLIVIDAAGRKAFCAGGDIVEMYRTATRGDLEYGRRFWRDEYRLNARLARSRPPAVSFLNGYTMGGGVGIGCHLQYRIVGESSRIAMPECAIGLVPDVGGSYLLSRAPGRIGEFMGISGTRAGPGDAIFARLADVFVPEAFWPELISKLEETGDTGAIEQFRSEPPAGSFRHCMDLIDRIFSLPGVAQIIDALGQDSSELAAACLKLIGRNAPLSMACALKLIRMQRMTMSIEEALALEYRVVHRSVEQLDFIEGIRAMVIDKDNKPKWRHSRPDLVSNGEVDALLATLGDQELELETRK